MRRPACLLLSLCIAVCISHVSAATWRVADSVDIGDVPASFPVRFSLLTHGGKHFVAYYNAAREMTVAECEVDGQDWQNEPCRARSPGIATTM